MKLSVHGSRGLEDERVRILLLEEIEKYNVTHIVTNGEPDGVCHVARKLAKEKAIPLTLHFLNFKYLRGAFEHRSIAMIKDANRAVFIWDGKSKGTANEKKLADKMNHPYTFHKLDPSPHKVSVGFPITEDWGTTLEVSEADFDQLRH